MRKKIEKLIAKLLILSLCIQCITITNISADENKTDTYQNKFVPQDKQTMLFIGQDHDEIADYIKATGVVPAGMMIYTNLGDLSGMNGSFEGAGANQAGRMDFQDWSKRYNNVALNLGIWASDRRVLQNIISGTYDANIKRLTDFMQASEKPIYVRFGYEFDGPWNVYAPNTYIAAYKHFVDVVRERCKQNEKNDNISFVWHSAAFFRYGENNIWPGVDYDKAIAESYLAYPEFTLDEWYPGDEYVDWVGISWFAWEHEFQEKTASIRRDEAVAFAKEHGKPVMIAEASTKEVWQPINPSGNCCDNGKVCEIGETGFTHSGDSWTNWFEPMFKYIEANDIKALCYINQDWNAQLMWQLQGGWGDSRVQQNADFLAKWIQKISEPRYLMSTNELYSQIGFKKGSVQPETTKPTDNTGSDNNSYKIVVKQDLYKKTIGTKPFYLDVQSKMKLSYQSNNTKVATVDSKGKVAIKGYGTAIITIKETESSVKNITKKITVIVIPKKVSKVKVVSQKKKIQVRWKKDKTITGYQIQYAKNKTFTKGVKNIKIKNKKKTAYALAKKKGFVRVRSYVKVKGVTFYSEFSKKIKLK